MTHFGHFYNLFQVYERVCDLGSGLINVCSLKRSECKNFVGIFGINCVDVSMKMILFFDFE